MHGKAYLNLTRVFITYRSWVSQFEDLLIVQTTLAMLQRGVCVRVCVCVCVCVGGGPLRQLCPL